MVSSSKNCGDNNVQKINKLIRKNRRITQHEIAYLVSILKEKVNRIIKNELQFWKILHEIGSEDAHRRNKEETWHVQRNFEMLS